MEPIVIGISGVSCGGKSVLCKRIVEQYPSATVISMDDYFHWPDVDEQLEYLPEYNPIYANFEVPSAVNFEKLHQDLVGKIAEVQTSSQKNRCPIILVEGILIFEFRPLQRYFAKRYFFTLTKDVAKERRRHRTYNPPDPIGYFDKYVWPYYIKHKENLVDQTDIVYIDGSTDAEKTLEKICQDLDSLMAAKNVPV